MTPILMKKLKIFLLCFCATYSLSSAANENRIISGNIEDVSSAPFLISLRYKHNGSAPFVHRCAGTIYSTNHILTTARCVVGLKPKQLQVVAGTSFSSESDGLVYLVKSIIIHPDFNIFYINNDLAILHLEFPFAANKAKLIRPIDMADVVPAGGNAATVFAWGDSQTDPLHAAKVQVFSDEQCNTAYSGGRITPAMFCASSVNGTSNVINSCTGDAGSALVSNNTAVGLVSWASLCGREGHPGVYTNLVNLKGWIESETS